MFLRVTCRVLLNALHLPLHLMSHFSLLRLRLPLLGVWVVLRLVLVLVVWVSRVVVVHGVEWKLGFHVFLSLNRFEHGIIQASLQAVIIRVQTLVMNELLQE